MCFIQCHQTTQNAFYECKILSHLQTVIILGVYNFPAPRTLCTGDIHQESVIRFLDGKLKSSVYAPLRYEGGLMAINFCDYTTDILPLILKISGDEKPCFDQEIVTPNIWLTLMCHRMRRCVPLLAH